jgi:opacity protein-like surface antigen
MRKRNFVLALAVAAAVTASAQVAVDGQNRQVKRIVFNGEQMTVVYADGTQQTDVQQTHVKRGSGVATKLRTTEAKTTTPKRIEYYTADGRKMDKAPVRKGLYIERRNGKYLKKVKP